MEQPVKKVLKAIGDNTNYQYLTFFLLFLLNIYVNLVMVGPTFIFMNPLFKCQPDTTVLLDESEACSIISLDPTLC